MPQRRVVLGACALVLTLFIGTALGLAIASAGDLHRLSVTADRWLNPQTTVRHDPVVLVRSVKKLARLETASMTLEKRVVGQRGDETTWAWVGERLEFIARGEAVAGVDLAALEEGAIEVREDAVWVTLPPAELWRIDLDEKESFVRARERGWFGVPDKDLESEVRRHAEDALRQEALDLDILGKADDQAKIVVSELLTGAGVQAVRFR